MQQETFDTILKMLHDERQDMALRKRIDYAIDSDMLDNFKRLSEAAKILRLNIQTPYGYAMFMVIMKLDRINNLIRQGRDPVNESLKDSFIDAFTYLELTYANLYDKYNDDLNKQAKAERNYLIEESRSFHA